MAKLGYPHEVKHVDISTNAQKEEWYLKINPNGRIPAIIDHDNDDMAVFESGAIMMYLAEKAGKLFPQDFTKKYEVIEWLMFQMAGVGPMQGQANHFVKFAPEPIPYARKRYYDETLRLYSVLEARLEGRQYLAGDDDGPDGYTIADIANFSWVVAAPFAGVDVSKDKFPNLSAWLARIYERPAVKEGLEVPKSFMLKEQYDDPEKMAEMIKKGQEWMQ